MKQNKVAKCKVCRTEFIRYQSTKQVCSVPCAMEFAKQRAEKKRQIEAKEFREETKRLKERLKTKADWLREAQQAFNAYIRIRDKGQPCISCQRHHKGQYHAGHYRTTKAAPQLRFNTFNVFKQCQPCNAHLSGNITEYRINLVKKIGAKKVDFIESNNESRPYSIEYAKRVKKIFRAKSRLYERKFR